MDVLFLAFANSRTNPLPTLAGEYAEINKILSPRVLRQHFLSWSVSHATTDDIAFYLTLFRDRLSLFLFSGHAGRDALLAEDGTARAGGIAHLLGQCPNLKAVILNGCSTAGQVADLHRAGVPLVIATSAPVDDEIAAKFSAHLFQALEAGMPLGEAFEQAIGEAQMRRSLQVDRGPSLRDETDPNLPLWGIKPNPEKPDAAGWKLPVQASLPAALQSEPNELLLKTLYEALAQTNPAVRSLREAGNTLAGRQKRTVKNAIEEAFPAPISEQLRKVLNTSLAEETDGYDKIGQKRLDQLARTYQVSMDFLIYVLLAQLWELSLRDGDPFTPPADLCAALLDFLHLNVEERRDSDNFSVLSQLTGAFSGATAAPLFVEEVSSLHEDLSHNDAVKNACFFLETLRRQSAGAGVLEMAELCARAEESLALVLAKLNFLGRYFVATVRNIGVLKPRHVQKAEFEHLVVIWHGTNGDCSSETVVHLKFLDSRSVVLLRLGEHADDALLFDPDDGGKSPFLNLSPFVIDENTFEEMPTKDLSKLYFYAGAEGGKLWYKYVAKPDEERIDLEDPNFQDKETGISRFHLAKEQFETFLNTVLREPVTPAEP